jgi:hypothetical protein
VSQVLIDGVGVLGIALDKAFEDGGYLGLVLFPLLEKLASPSYHIRRAAAVVLNTLCIHCQHLSVSSSVINWFLKPVDNIITSFLFKVRAIV